MEPRRTYVHPVLLKQPEESIGLHHEDAGRTITIRRGEDGSHEAKVHAPTRARIRGGSSKPPNSKRSKNKMSPRRKR